MAGKTSLAEMGSEVWKNGELMHVYSSRYSSNTRRPLVQKVLHHKEKCSIGLDNRLIRMKLFVLSDRHCELGVSMNISLSTVRKACLIS